MSVRNVAIPSVVEGVSLIGAGSLGEAFVNFMKAARDSGQKLTEPGASLPQGTTTTGLALAHQLFSKGPNHIPNANGHAYKTEWVPFRHPELGTLKVNWWKGADDLRDPHNHPWVEFQSHIITGGYTEVRYWIDEQGKLQSEKFTYKQGDVNIFPQNQYHLVTEVEPETMTMMLCGKATPGNTWGYVEVNTAGTRNADPDPTFMARSRVLNAYPANKPA